MDIIHAKLVFEDTFSYAKTTKYTTVSKQHTFDKMKESIGEVVIDRFNKSSQIHETIRLLSVEHDTTNGI
jgi:hypothetical protein